MLLFIITPITLLLAGCGEQGEVDVISDEGATEIQGVRRFKGSEIQGVSVVDSQFSLFGG
jgi:hypothetical protein